MAAKKKGLPSSLAAGLTRKELRKKGKEFKKLKRQAHHLKRPKEELLEEAAASKRLPLKPKKIRPKKVKIPPSVRHYAEQHGIDVDEIKENVRRENGGRVPELNNEEWMRAIENERITRVRSEMEEDEKEMRMMAKMLGYDKRKSKNQPQMFKFDGIDGLLNYIDAKDRRAYEVEAAKTCGEEEEPVTQEDLIREFGNTSENDEEIDEDEEENESMIDEEEMSMEGEGEEEDLLEEEMEDEEHALENEEEGDEQESDLEMEEDEVEQEEETGESDGESESGAEEQPAPLAAKKEKASAKVPQEEAKEETEAPAIKVKEDIYGRQVNVETGQLIERNEDGARRKLEELEANISPEERKKVERAIVGVLNRLTEETLVKCKYDLQEAIREFPLREVKSVFTRTLLRLLGSTTRLQEKIVALYGVFVGIIHASCSSDISAFLMEELLVKNYVDLLLNSKMADDASMENKTVFIAHLLNFRVIKVEVVMQLLEQLQKNLDVDRLKLVNTLCGHSFLRLKSDSPQFLHEFLNKMTTTLQDPQFSYGRPKFLGEDLLTLKKSAPSWVDMTVVEHFRSVYNQILHLKKKSTKESELSMTLTDLLDAETKGRWWVVGSAYNPMAASTSGSSSANKESSTDPAMDALARKAGMNTEIRRGIFSSVVTANDEDEAVHNIGKLGLNKQQLNEVIPILVQMMFKEKDYNPFYSSIIRNLCDGNKLFWRSAEFSMFGRLRELDGLTPRTRSHLAHLLASLLLSRTIPIKVLKAIEWGMMTPAGKIVVKKILQLVLKAPVSVLQQVFKPVLDPKQARSDLTNGLTMFLQMNFPDHLLLHMISNAMYS